MTDPTREAFEAWARTQTNRIDALNRKGDGYVITTAQIMWLAWQAALAQQGREVGEAWQEGYRQGVLDERTSEANIGIAGFGAKVEPARNNPYALAALPGKTEVDRG